MLSIAIVGGGAAAVCLLDAISQTSASDVGRIIVFEAKRDDLWTGRPYRVDDPSMLLNSRADDMSARVGDNTHFARWLGARRVQSEFATRSVYGHYLRDTAEQALSKLVSCGWLIEVVHDRVVGATRAQSSVRLETERGSRWTVTHAVLAVGIGPPDDIYNLDSHKGYIRDPLPVAETLSTIDRDSRVAVIGSGLSAVDVVLGLQAQAHSGAIAMFSRKGVLPAVRQRKIRADPRYLASAALTGSSLDRVVSQSDIICAVRRELTHNNASISEIASEIASMAYESVQLRLERQLREIEGQQVGLRLLQSFIPAAGPKVWPVLAYDVRKAVLDTHRREFMSLCCPMPPESAQKLLSMIRAGQLTVHSDLRSITPTVTGFQISQSALVESYPVVINAVTAPRHRIPPAARPLVNSLLNEGLARLHPDGGLCVQPDRSLCNSRYGSANQPKIYALGDVAAGTFFFTFGIVSIVQRVREVVDDLYSQKSRREWVGVIADVA